LNPRPHGPERNSGRFGVCHQRSFGFIPSALEVRRVPLRDAECRLGCYTRCYTSFGDSKARLSPVKTSGDDRCPPARDHYAHI
jgi:hypothetical protein